MEYPLSRDEVFSRSKIINKRQTSRIHYHNECELYFMLEGRTTYIIRDEIYSVETGDFVFIPRGIPHMTDSMGCMNRERLLLNFSEDLFTEKTMPLLDQLSRHRVIYVQESAMPVLKEIMYKIESEYQQKEANHGILLELYILELLTLLCRYQCQRKPNIEESDRIVYTISEYISSHYEQDITLENLSKIFAFSEGYLSRKFKNVTGMGVNHYITYVRIGNAEKMLAETDCSVTEIAENCGFNNSNYFSMVFKKAKGVSPLTYRRQKRG